MHTKTIYLTVLALVGSIALGVPLGSKTAPKPLAIPKPPVAVPKAPVVAPKPPAALPTVAKPTTVVGPAATVAKPPSAVTPNVVATPSAASVKPPTSASKSLSAVVPPASATTNPSIISSPANASVPVKPSGSNLTPPASNATAASNSTALTNSTAASCALTTTAGGKIVKRCTDPSPSETTPGTITLNNKKLALTFLAKGEHGIVFNIGGQSGAVAKRSTDGTSLDQEKVNSARANALVDSGEGSDGQSYLILKKIVGKVVSKTDAAAAARKAGECSFYMAAARNLAAGRQQTYVTTAPGIKHGDLSIGNILYQDTVPADEDEPLASVDFVDWGQATPQLLDAAGGASVKTQTARSLATTLGFRDEDCVSGWAGITGA